MIENKYRVLWKNISANTFMYGTTIQFKDGVHFENKLMPSGTVIHEWLMTTQYFKDRHVPSLPILQRNHEYQITFDYEEEPTNSVYFKISFYRRNTRLIDTVIIEGKSATFHYPKDAYSYKIEMLSASVVSFHFKEMTIQSKACEQTVQFSDVFRKNRQPLNLIIEEPSIFQHRLRPDAFKHLNHVVICYTHDIDIIKDYVKDQAVHFIGYGEKSNALALQLAKQSNQKAFISHHGAFDGNVYSSKTYSNEIDRYRNPSHCLKQLQMTALENR